MIAFADVVQRAEFIAGDLEEAQRRCDARERIVNEPAPLPIFPLLGFARGWIDAQQSMALRASRPSISGRLGAFVGPAPMRPGLRWRAPRQVLDAQYRLIPALDPLRVAAFDARLVGQR